jgi:hypothetical protein
MIKLKSLLKEDSGGYEFVGFHRQQHARPSSRDDVFLVSKGNGGNYYGKEYFIEILESLYNNDRNEAAQLGWMDYDWSNVYSDDYEEMQSKVSDWLNGKGYRWIFVTESRPHDIEGYGKYIYKIFFKPSDILHVFDDPFGANDIAYAYVYNIKNPPRFEKYDQT